MRIVASRTTLGENHKFDGEAAYLDEGAIFQSAHDIRIPPAEFLSFSVEETDGSFTTFMRIQPDSSGKTVLEFGPALINSMWVDHATGEVEVKPRAPIATASLPGASSWAGDIRVTSDNGLVYSDGTHWREPDGTIVA